MFTRRRSSAPRPTRPAERLMARLPGGWLLDYDPATRADSRDVTTPPPVFPMEVQA
jgi:hypothetical protein